MAALDSSKILTISARDFCEMNNKKLSDYVPVGVHFEGTGGPGSREETLLEFFQAQVPENAAFVVNYQLSVGGFTDVRHRHYVAAGTALIPKDE